MFYSIRVVLCSAMPSSILFCLTGFTDVGTFDRILVSCTVETAPKYRQRFRELVTGPPMGDTLGLCTPLTPTAAGDLERERRTERGGQRERRRERGGRETDRQTDKRQIDRQTDRELRTQNLITHGLRFQVVTYSYNLFLLIYMPTGHT